MAKRSIEAREVKRENCIKRYAAKRAAIMKQLRDPELGFEERLAVQKKLNKLPRNSAAVRHTKRCQLCGRPHAVYRKFSLCRICVRQTLMVGDAPGGTKSSW